MDASLDTFKVAPVDKPALAPEREFVRYYHECRPHQGLENDVVAKVEPPPMVTGEVECESSLGGLLKHYYRAA